MTDDRTDTADRPAAAVRRLRAQLVLTVVSLVLDVCLLVQRARRYRDARALDRYLTTHRGAR